MWKKGVVIKMDVFPLILHLFLLLLPTFSKDPAIKAAKQAQRPLEIHQLILCRRRILYLRPLHHLSKLLAVTTAIPKTATVDYATTRGAAAAVSVTLKMRQFNDDLFCQKGEEKKETEGIREGDY